MNKVIVRAPVRVDLAGGTLDLWPIYLFHPGCRTVNAAVSYYAEAEVAESGGGGIEVLLTDQQYRQSYASAQQMASDAKVALIHRAVEHFRLGGIRIVTRTDAPRGSGLGGSSALAVALVRALSEFAGQPVEGEDLIALVRDLETRVLGIPAGIQDYYPAVFGGLGSLHLTPGKPSRHVLQTPLPEFSAHLVLHHTGVSHFSGTNNWELYKRHVQGNKKVRKGFERIASVSVDMERALDAGNFEAAGAALRMEWETRKALIEGISTPEVDAAVEAATAAGAWGGKVCGAGGGGCVVFLLPRERREAVLRALTTVPGKVLDAAPVQHGMSVERELDAQMLFPIRSRLHARETQPGSIEQLYATGGRGDYRPYVLAEGIVTLSESRSGIRQSAVRSFLVPIASEDGRVLWQKASAVDAENLELRAVPEPDRQLAIDITPEALVQHAAQSQESFRQFLEENERLQVFHNPSFGFYSEPGESKATFLERCMDEANRQIDAAQERLESTFRRRIDQLRERSEREQREMEKNETPAQIDAQEVNVAWGQALYNITSGRPARVAEPATSVREGDYIENIMQIQRAWDRELQGIRDDLTAKAQSVEEITVPAAEKDIEITKYLILWQ